MTESSQEIWLPVPDFECHYEVSNQGRVRSLERMVQQNNRWGPCLRRFPSVILSPDVTKRGYRRVQLRVDGQGVKHSVHSLVAAAFIGPRPDGLQVCHNDGDNANNRVENLRYDTGSANVQDCVKHGTQAQARKTHCPQNHPYDEGNTTWVPTGRGSGRGRHCRTCKRLREAERRAAAKQKVAA